LISIKLLVAIEISPPFVWDSTQQELKNGSSIFPDYMLKFPIRLLLLNQQQFIVVVVVVVVDQVTREVVKYISNHFKSIGKGSKHKNSFFFSHFFLIDN